MANRTQKAAMKKRAEDEAKVAKAAKAPRADKSSKPAAKFSKGKTVKPAAAKGRGKRGKAALEFEEVPLPKPEGPGFFERLRQRRAEQQIVKAAEAQRRAVQREAEDKRARELEAERLAAAAVAAREAEAQAAVERKKAEAQAKRDAAKAARMDAARQEAEAKAAEEAAAAQRAEELKARRAEQRQAKRLELEAAEARKAAEQAERDAEEEAEKRRKAVQAAQRKEAEKAAELAKELEPEMEFQDAPQPVDPERAMVATERPAAAGAVDAQADLVAAELARRRAKPVVIVEDEPPVPRIPGFGSRSKKEEAPTEQVVVMADPAGRTAVPAAQEPAGMPLPEAFLLLANEGGWDERAEKLKPGGFGGALAGALLLEMLQQGQIQVQRDRIVSLRETTDDPAIAAVMARLAEIGDRPSLSAASAVAKRNRELLEPYKARLAERGLIEYGSRRHLGMFHRSWVNVLDEEAQDRLRNKLRRAIAGGGTPEASSILLLGLLDASGLLGSIVPDEAMDYNRKRLNGLLGGRDIMGYKVDPKLKALQEIAVRTILQNVRVMTVRG